MLVTLITTVAAGDHLIGYNSGQVGPNGDAIISGHTGEAAGNWRRKTGDRFYWYNPARYTDPSKVYDSLCDGLFTAEMNFAMWDSIYDYGNDGVDCQTDSWDAEAIYGWIEWDGTDDVDAERDEIIASLGTGTPSFHPFDSISGVSAGQNVYLYADAICDFPGDIEDVLLVVHWQARTEVSCDVNSSFLDTVSSTNDLSFWWFDCGSSACGS